MEHKAATPNNHHSSTPILLCPVVVHGHTVSVTNWYAQGHLEVANLVRCCRYKLLVEVTIDGDDWQKAW